MNDHSSINLSYSPGIQCLIPIFYVAWSDQVLSPSEVKLLREKAVRFSFLTPADKILLNQWSDPAHPPSNHLFKFWEIALQQFTQQIDNKAYPSLTDIGLTMAQQAPQEVENGINWFSPDIRANLEDLENNLVSINWNTYQNIFSDTSDSPKKSDLFRSARFDIQKMIELLDDNYGVEKNKMRTLLSDSVFKRDHFLSKENYRAQVLKWCKLLAKQGLGALAFPKEYGGENSLGAYAAVFEVLGYHDLSLVVKFGVQFGLFGGSVLGLGTKKHYDQYLNDIGTLSLPGCFAMTETGHGSNVKGLETTAVYDLEKQEFIIHTPRIEAGKEYIGNALHGRIAAVFAQLIVKGENHGVHAIMVPLRDENGQLHPGIKIEDCGYKLGLNGVDNGRIWFDNVRVPRENLLNRFGNVSPEGNYSSSIQNPSRRFFTMLGTLVGGRVCVPRAGLSATKSALTIAIRYALKRRQFGPSFNVKETLLLDYPSHQRRLMPLLAKAYALDFALTYLSQRFENWTAEDIREIETLAAALKAYSTWFTTDTIQECREACGGKGYLYENRFAALKADTDIFTTFEGDNTVLMQLVTKGVLSEYKKEFYEDGSIAILRYIGGRISTAITELNPIIIRNTDRNHLLSPDFYLNAFYYREKRMLYSLAQRIRGWIKQGESAYDAFLKCQTHSIDLGTAFAERIVLEQFIKIIDTEKTKNSGLQTTLINLCHLFALSTVEKHKGWYLEHDYISGSKSKAIRRLVDELCSEVRKDADSLVHAFAIPDECLAAKIVDPTE